MIKKEIISKVASDTMLKKVVVEDVINSFLLNIENALSVGDNVVIRGFGTFEVVEQKEKVGRNINEGTPMIIPAHLVPKFNASDALKKKIYKTL